MTTKLIDRVKSAGNPPVGRNNRDNRKTASPAVTEVRMGVCKSDDILLKL